MVIIKATKPAIFPYPLCSLGNDEGHREKVPRVCQSGEKEANIKWWSRQTRVRGRDRSLIKCGVQFTLPSGILCSALITPAILWDLMNLWCWTALRGRKHHQLAENARKDKCKHFTIRLINNTKPKLHCAQIMRKKILYSKIYFDPILMNRKLSHIPKI